eukprot:scaffold7953_cov220-Pinguiococcus_pyrenoidosus.AAC.2
MDPKDNYCASGSSTGELMVHHLGSGKLLRRVPQQAEDDGPVAITDVQWSPHKTRWVSVARQTGNILVWDINTCQVQMRSKGRYEHSPGRTSVAFSSINAYLVLSAGADGYVSFFDHTKGGCVDRINAAVGAPAGTGVSSLAFAKNGLLIATGLSNGDINFFDLRKPSEILFSLPDAHPGEAVQSLSFCNKARKKDSAAEEPPSSITSSNAEEAKSSQTEDVSRLEEQEPSSRLTARESHPLPPPPDPAAAVSAAPRKAVQPTNGDARHLSPPDGVETKPAETGEEVRRARVDRLVPSSPEGTGSTLALERKEAPDTLARRARIRRGSFGAPRLSSREDFGGSKDQALTNLPSAESTESDMPSAELVDSAGLGEMVRDAIEDIVAPKINALHLEVLRGQQQQRDRNEAMMKRVLNEIATIKEAVLRLAEEQRMRGQVPNGNSTDGFILRDFNARLHEH